jgi:hypothetical protein
MFFLPRALIDIGLRDASLTENDWDYVSQSTNLTSTRNRRTWIGKYIKRSEHQVEKAMQVQLDSTVNLNPIPVAGWCSPNSFPTDIAA